MAIVHACYAGCKYHRHVGKHESANQAQGAQIRPSETWSKASPLDVHLTIETIEGTMTDLVISSLSLLGSVG